MWRVCVCVSGVDEPAASHSVSAQSLFALMPLHGSLLSALSVSFSEKSCENFLKPSCWAANRHSQRRAGQHPVQTTFGEASCQMLKTGWCICLNVHEGLTTCKSDWNLTSPQSHIKAIHMSLIPDQCNCWMTRVCVCVCVCVRERERQRERERETERERERERVWVCIMWKAEQIQSDLVCDH